MPTSSRVTYPARGALVLGGLACGFFMVGPFQGLERAVVPWDKAAHFLAFYGFTLMLYLSFPRRRRLDLTILSVFLGCAVEGMQALSGRDAGLGDMLANASGALAVLAPMYVETLRIRARGAGIADRRRRRLASLSAGPDPAIGPGSIPAERALATAP